VILKKAKTAVFWSLFSTFGGMVLQLIFGVIMARLLTPKDFGIMSIAIVISVVSKGIIDGGFYQAIIQKKNIDKDELSAVFKINLIISIILSLLIYFNSANIASFFDEQSLLLILKIFSFIIVVESLSGIQKAILIKEIQFKLISKIELISIFIASIVGILLALNDFGVYSLMYKIGLQVILTTCLFWVLHPIKINWFASWSKLKGLFNFGIKVYAADQIEIVSNQIAVALIGKVYNSENLGYYTKAIQYQNLLSQTVIVSINKVVFPTFAKIQNEDDKLKGGYRILIKLSTLVIFPLMFASILISKELILLLIGDQWIETIPYFRILCIGGMVYPFTVFNLNIIKVKGLGSLYFKVCLFSKGLLLPAILVGMNFGILGVIYAIIIQQIIAAVINSIYSGKLINFTLLDQLKDVYIYFISALLLFIIGILIKSVYNIGALGNISSISITLFMFFISYLGLLFIFKKEDIKKLFELIFR
jgi:teichuronic acid exporter